MKNLTPWQLHKKAMRRKITENLAAFYLEFVNDFLTVDRFAEYYSISKVQCLKYLKAGKRKLALQQWRDSIQQMQHDQRCYGENDGQFYG